ncbi:GNAT family N-acetyltransferase [bacterium]|nr:GNAT family N-acetyltransferase [bacterium]
MCGIFIGEDSVQIRPLISSDKKKLLEILNDLKSLKIFKQEEIECALELIDIYLNNDKQTDYECYSCINEKDVFWGYVCFGKVPLTDAVYDLYWIVVDPDIHRQGIGRKLMEFVEDKLKSRNARKLLLETASLPVYEATRNFYIALGYKEIARIKDFYSLGDDRITYEKLFV